MNFCEKPISELRNYADQPDLRISALALHEVFPYRAGLSEDYAIASF